MAAFLLWLQHNYSHEPAATCHRLPSVHHSRLPVSLLLWLREGGIIVVAATQRQAEKEGAATRAGRPGVLEHSRANGRAGVQSEHLCLQHLERRLERSQWGKKKREHGGWWSQQEPAGGSLGLIPGVQQPPTPTRSESLPCSRFDNPPPPFPQFWVMPMTVAQVLQVLSPVAGRDAHPQSCCVLSRRPLWGTSK